MLRVMAFVVALPLGMQGCASTQVYGGDGKAVGSSIAKPLLGKIEYSGNPEYLPRMLSADTGIENKVIFRYSYTVSYEAPNEHPLTVFNPLLMLGMSKATDTVVVIGVLDIVKEGTLLKHYEKSLVLKKDKTVFSEGETLTDMRRKGLMLVRDHIDSQLVQDRAMLAPQINAE
jgi:hypothetical protein